jgi:branched-chain amino acid transport system substrate-binding protein
MRKPMLLAACLLVAACGDGSGGAGTAAKAPDAKVVKIYSSLPLQGASRPQSTSMVNAFKLAIEQAGGKAGPFKVEYASLDDSTAQAGSWTPEATQANARKVVLESRDGAAVYLGELNSGATAISLPILNEAGVPQISTNTAVGLTAEGPGTTPGEPAKYYPTGERTYFRTVPKDDIQGAALASIMREDGCTRVFMVNDKEVYGAGLAGNLKSAAQGFAIVSDDGIEKTAANFRSLAAKAASARADCFVYAGIVANNAVQLYKDMAAALPQAKLYGPDGVAEANFTDPDKGGLPPAVAARVKVTVATLAPSEYPLEGREFFTAYAAAYGDDAPDPYAIYGYEAMRLALDAIARSGTAENADIVKALRETKDRSSVLGTYSIDPNGDTTLTDYGIYTISGGKLAFEETIHARR